MLIHEMQDYLFGSLTFTDNGNNAYARIETIADAAPGANDFPGAIVFSTTPDGSASPTESLRITSGGYVSIPDDSGRFTAGSSNDLQIYHDSSNSYIEDTGTGALIMKGSTVRIRSTTNENMLSASQNGAISLYYDNSVKLETTSTGIDVTGKTDTDTLNVSGLSTLQGTLEFDSTLQSYDPAGGGGSDTSTSAAIALPSGKKIVGVDDGYIRSLLSWSDASNIIIGQQNTSKIQGIQLKPGTNAGVGLHYGGTGDNLKFRTTSTGVDVLGGIDVEGGDIVFDSDTESNFLYISRHGSTSNEFTRISRGDSATTFLTKNDEASSTVRFRIQNTDTEAGGGANANDRNIDLISDATSARIVIDGNRVLTVADEGSGNGLDADTLDGQQGSYYTNAANLTGTLPAIDGSSLTGIIASNATTLDNLDSSQFIRSDANDTFSGNLTSTASSGAFIEYDGSNTGPYLKMSTSGTENGYIQFTNTNAYVRNSRTGKFLSISSYISFHDGTGDRTIWHEGNDGPGSGLNADLLDNLHQGSFLRSDADDQFTGTITASSDGSNPIILVKGSGPNFIRFASDSSGTVDADSIDFVYRATPNTLGFERSSDGTTFWTTDADTGVTNFNYTPTVSGSSIFNASNLNAGTIPDARIPDVITPTTRVQTQEIRANGTQLVLNAGEAAGKFSGQTAEQIYLNSEQGVVVSTSAGNNNFQSGWYPRRTIINGEGIHFYMGDSETPGTQTKVGEITSQDTVWLRINQTTAKNIYTPRYIRADGGFFVDGTAKGINGSGNFIGGTIAGASDVTDANTANTVVKRNGSSDINCRLVRQSYQNQSTISGGIVYRINNSNDNYLRVCNSPSAIRTFLGVSATAGDGNYLRSNTSDQYDGQTSGRVMRFRCVDGRNAGNSGGSRFPLEVYQNSNTSNSDAAMAFHIAGRYAAYFGLNRETNDLFWGGWSRGAAKYKVWHAANDGSGSGLDADTVDGIQGGSFLRSDANDSASGEITFNGRVNIRGHLDFADEEYIYLGSSDDTTIRHNSNGWTYVDFKQNGMVFRDNGSDKIILEDSGIIRPSANNTGALGTSSRRWANIWATKINFAANSTDTANITTTVSGSNTYLDFNLTDDNNQEQFRWRFNPTGSSIYNAMQLKPTANGESTLIVSGDIGIGATPGSNLAGRAHCLAIGDSDTGIAQNGDGQFEIWANNQEICNFDTGEIHAYKPMRVANDFRVATTNTFPGHNNSNGGFHIEDASQGTSMFCSRKDNTAAYFNRNNNGDIVSFRRNGNEKGRVTMNSNSVTFNTTSDYRLKENVVVLDNAINRVKQLQPKRFNFIGDPDETLDGFFAHEAQEVVPECATGTKDEMEDVGTLTEWDGTVISAGYTEPSADEMSWEETIDNTTHVRTRTWVKTGEQPVYQGIDHSRLVPVLTAALQEAITKIEQLEARITQLEST